MENKSFKEKQKLFQKKAEKTSEKSNAIDRNESIKSGLILKLANDLENKQKSIRDKSSDKFNRSKTNRDNNNNNKNEIKENIELLNNKRYSKDNISKIKIEVEELLNKKEKGKNKNNDKEINDNAQKNIVKNKSFDINENKSINDNENIEEGDNDAFSNRIGSDFQIIEIKKEKKDTNISKNIKLNIDNNIANNKNIFQKKNLSDLEVDDFKDFKEEYYSERKYDKKNIDQGKLFFKYRYLKDKYNHINETIQKLTSQSYNKDNKRKN